MRWIWTALGTGCTDHYIEKYYSSQEHGFNEACLYVNSRLIRLCAKYSCADSQQCILDWKLELDLISVQIPNSVMLWWRRFTQCSRRIKSIAGEPCNSCSNLFPLMPVARVGIPTPRVAPLNWLAKSSLTSEWTRCPIPLKSLQCSPLQLLLPLQVMCYVDQTGASSLSCV